MTDRLRIDIQNGVLVAHRDGCEPVPLAGATIGGRGVPIPERKDVDYPARAIRYGLSNLKVAQQAAFGEQRLDIYGVILGRAHIAALLPHLIRFVETGTLEGDNS